MGVYLSTYTAQYPGSVTAESGYVFSALDAVGYGGVDLPKVLDGVWEERSERSPIATRVAARFPAKTFIKVADTWRQVKTIPPVYDRLVGGGYASPITLTELNELLAAGLITTAEYNSALATGN